MRSHERIRYMIAVMRKLGGVHPRECPLCGFRGLFLAVAHPPRYDAVCPSCESRERHRLLGLFFKSRPDLGGGARIVHFAPEPVFAKELRRRGAEYRSADLFAAGVDLKLDIEAMELADASVDLFVANHVLEHVDHRSALAELFRCLSAGGHAILTMPVVEGWKTTYENAAVAKGDSDADRILHFGWPDHLRWFGADIRDHIREAGFELSEFTGTGEEAVRYGLVRGETVFVAKKPE